jgi:hypothetical protein
MIDRKPGAAVWATMFLVVSVLMYLATFGPMVGLASRGHIGESIVERVYWPILSEAARGPEPVMAGIDWWGSLFVPANDALFLGVHVRGGGMIPVPFFGRDWKPVTSSDPMF